MDVIVISDDEPAGPSIGASKTRHRQLQQLSSEDEDFTPKAKPARKRAPKQAAQDMCGLVCVCVGRRMAVVAAVPHGRQCTPHSNGKRPGGVSCAIDVPVLQPTRV
jgi:hypothetical protein